MVLDIVASITAFIISYLITPIIIKYSLKKNIVDVPGRRKIHKKITPSMGGVAIFMGFTISSLLWIDMSAWKEIKSILLALFVVFIIGVRDDLISLRMLFKLGGQLFSAILLVLSLDIRLTSLYGLFGIYEIPLAWSYFITVFTIIIVTNSFNLIDGLDGLAGTVSAIAFFAFGIWFLGANEIIFSTLSMAMLGAIIAFLIFNWEPSKIFMGDTGALVIGMMLSILAIRFTNVNYRLPETSIFKFSGTVSMSMIFLIVPLTDTLRIIIIRLSKRQSPLKADKSHIHHAIMRLGMTHSQTTIILGGIQIFYLAIGVVFRKTTDLYLLPGIIIVSIVLGVILDRLLQRKLEIKTTNGPD